GGTERGQGSEFTLLLAVARGMLETGDTKAAEKAVQRVGERYPAAWEPAYWRGRVEHARGHLEAARAALSTAREKGAREFLDLEYWSAVFLKEAGNAEAAAATLEKVLRAKPGYKNGYELLAEILSPAGGARLAALEKTHGHVPSALRRIERLEAAIGGRPLDQLGAVYLELGTLYRSLRDPIAFDFFFLARALRPGNAAVLKQLISGMTRPQDIFPRLQCLHRLLALEPDLPAPAAEIAGIYIRLKVRLDVARDLTERLHRSTPSAVSFRLLGELALAAGKPEEGRRWLTEGLAAFPGDARLQQSLETEG
ncbi:MAG: hypothetical protein V3S71_05870, partial [Acidobacteriota bacterium]